MSLSHYLPCLHQTSPGGTLWIETHAITSAYAETVHRHHNLFLVPSGEAGTSFVTHLAKLFRAYGEGAAIESIALSSDGNANTSTAETPCKI